VTKNLSFFALYPFWVGFLLYENYFWILFGFEKCLYWANWFYFKIQMIIGGVFHQPPPLHSPFLSYHIGNDISYHDHDKNSSATANSFNAAIHFQSGCEW
jgi:hypothetical protein